MNETLIVFDQKFIASRWRRQPQVWRRAFDPSNWDMSKQRMEAVVASARAAHSEALHSSEDTDFLEHAELHDNSGWGLLSQALAACTRRQLRIDITITRRAGGGIGAHFDDSDNFVFQVAGRKLWRLHSPDILDPSVVHARLSKLRGVGRCNIPEDTCEEYVLEPGDILYLPFLWPHWGLSDDASTSVSAVVQALTPLGAIALLHEKTKGAAAMLTPLDEEDDLVDDLAKRIRRSLAAARPIEGIPASIGVDQSTDSTMNISPQGPSSHVTATKEHLPLDMVRVRDLARRWVRPVPFGNIVLANDVATDDLQSSFAAYMLKRSCQVLVRASQRIASESSYQYLRTFASILSQEVPSTLFTLLVSPLYTAVVHKLKYFLDIDDIEGIHIAICAWGTCFLDVLVASGSGNTFLLPILTEPAGVVHLPMSGYLLPLNGQVAVARYVAGFSIQFDDSQGLTISTISLPIDASRAEFVALPRIGEAAPAILAGAAILRTYYPRDRASRANVLEHTLAGEDLKRYQEVLSGAWRVLKTVDPTGVREAAKLISLITPVKNNQGLHPNNQSMHAFRGLVAMSARPTYMSAQVFMHESGHNKFSTVLDLCQLYDPTRTAATLYSPFTQCERPVTGLLHGVFSFARDLAITREMIGRVVEIDGYPMDRYYEKNLARWKTAYETVQRHVALNESGKRLLAEFEQVASMLGSPLP